MPVRDVVLRLHDQKTLVFIDALLLHECLAHEDDFLNFALGEGIVNEELAALGGKDEVAVGENHHLKNLDLRLCLDCFLLSSRN